MKERYYRRFTAQDKLRIPAETGKSYRYLGYSAERGHVAVRMG